MAEAFNAGLPFPGAVYHSLITHMTTMLTTKKKAKSREKRRKVLQYYENLFFQAFLGGESNYAEWLWRNGWLNGCAFFIHNSWNEWLWGGIENDTNASCNWEGKIANEKLDSFERTKLANRMKRKWAFWNALQLKLQLKVCLMSTLKPFMSAFEFSMFNWMQILHGVELCKHFSDLLMSFHVTMKSFTNEPSSQVE